MSQIAVTLLRADGSDLDVCRAARVSFSKTTDWEWHHEQGSQPERKLSERDARLIRYLAREGHWSPLSHVGLSLHVRAPLFVARQAWKSHVGCVGGDAGMPAWNEVSLRYVDETPEFYTPSSWRLRAANKKQGSSDQTIELWPGAPDGFPTISESFASYLDGALQMYSDMIASGIAPEQARMVLPACVMSQWHWTGSLVFFARVCGLRLKPDAQAETRDVALQISEIAASRFPVSWAALMGVA